MPVLEIHYPSGEVETRELVRDVPVSIGRADFNDIPVDAPDVAPVHCRISAKKSNYLVTAAVPSGVDCNGLLTAHTVLESGDVLRIGDLEIVYLDAPRPPAPESPIVFEEIQDEKQPLESEEIQLRPASSDDIPLMRAPGPAGAPPPEKPPLREHDPPRGPQAAVSGLPPQPLPDRPAGAGDVTVPPSEAEVLDGEIIELPDRARPAAAQPRRERVPAHAATGRLGVRPVRPGEQDVLRSPLVLGLGGGALALLLAAATLWFVLDRESAQRTLDNARKSQDSGLYAEAIEGFERFLKEHPRHKQADAARVALGTARVDQAIAGSTPAWDRGLAELNRLIDQYKNDDDFHDSESMLRQFVVKSAGTIALGAADTARTSRKQSALAVSDEAVRLLEFYQPQDSSAARRLDEIAARRRAAEAAILKQTVFDDATREIDRALEDRNALTAFATHRKLLERYADFAASRPLADRLSKALVLERSRVVREAAPAVPDAEPPPDRPVGLSLVRRTRTRTDEASVGATVFAVAQNCCYGIDTVTGAPLWRRVIGLDVPFFPVPVEASVPSLLVFDSTRQDLLLLEQRTGKLIWRQPLGETPTDGPLIHSGQILLATRGGHLWQLDIGTGRPGARLQFPQGISGPPALAHSGERLYVAGHESALYVLKRSPLACEAIVYSGHAAGAISAPLLMLRSYLLVAENDRLKSSRLRLWDTGSEDRPPVEIATVRIDGLVRESPVIRGKQLFVPSTPEQIHAFTVSETGDRQALKLAASFQVKNPYGGPLFLTAGPDDQTWMAGSALRKFQLLKDSLRADKQQLPVGLSTQPLQSAGSALFLGRQLPYSRAVFFTDVDRTRMVGQWQVVLGAPILAVSGPGAREGAGVACVTATGDVHTVTAARLKTGGFELLPLAQLPLPENLDSPLQTVRLDDGRLAVSCGGAQPRVWFISTDGQVQAEYKPAQPLEAAPLLFAGGMLLPTNGKLHIVGRPATESPLEDFVPAVAKGKAPRWRGVARLDSAQVVTLDERGRVTRLQIRTSPVGHLAEVAHWDAGRPVDLAPLVDRGHVFVADTGRRLTMLDASSLEPLAEVLLEQAATQPLWMSQERLLVEVGGSQLACFDPARQLQQNWTLALPQGVSLAGAPWADGKSLILALRNGLVWKVDAESGSLQSQLDLQQPIALPPQPVAGLIVVGTLDGSLLPLEALLEPAS